MDDLIARIRAAIDENERVALLADGARWEADGAEVAIMRDMPSDVAIAKFDVLDEVTAAHIVCHNPARVLRQVAAHRKILDAREANTRKLAEHQAEWLSLMRTPGGANYDKQQDRHLIQRHLSKLHGRQEAFNAMVSAIAEAYGIDPN